MTKIDIISGFLGAGKTTLIKKLLEEVFKGEKVVLKYQPLSSHCVTIYTLAVPYLYF